MTKDDACQLAIEYARMHKLPVSGVASFHRIPSDLRFVENKVMKGDVWRISFHNADADEVISSRIVTLEVEDATGEVSRWS